MMSHGRSARRRLARCRARSSNAAAGGTSPTFPSNEPAPGHLVLATRRAVRVEADAHALVARPALRVVAAALARTGGGRTEAWRGDPGRCPRADAGPSR